jgi:hypothetical protein
MNNHTNGTESYTQDYQSSLIISRQSGYAPNVTVRLDRSLFGLVLCCGPTRQVALKELSSFVLR